MSEVKHTPEPWNTDRYSGFIIRDSSGDILGSMHGENGFNNARRIVACVNACAGAPTEWLERHHKSDVDVAVKQVAQIIDQRDELLSALKELFENYKQLADSGDAGNWSLEDKDVGKKALNIIAKCEKQ